MKVTKCNHQGGCIYNMCVLCGENLDGCSVSHVGLRDIICENARLSSSTPRLKSCLMDTLLCQKKLDLVLDLDFTLLHTTMLKDLTPDEEYLKTDVSKESSLFISEHKGLMTKLRPFVPTFLREASEIFEMYINTMGNRSYAEQMVNLLDKNISVAESSRDDHGTCIHQKHQKSLEVLQGLERAVVILDDTEE